MKIRRFILNRILNARQREMIWAALLFSAHTYKRRGNMEGFAAVTRVLDETQPILGVKERTWTREEVEALIEESSEHISRKINEIAQDAYKKGVHAGRSEAIQERIKEDTEHAHHIEEFADTLRPFGIVIGVRRGEDSEGLQPGHEFSKEKCEGCENKEDCELYNVVLKDEFESAEGEDENKENGTEKAEETDEHADTEEGKTEGEDKHE
nr:MAG TPA: hypothetical protein [Caudoviricetes sp.]